MMMGHACRPGATGLFPGLVEALVLLREPGVGEGDFSAFCQEAEFLGFTGRLISPLDE